MAANPERTGKTCTDCGQTKALEQFHRNKGRSDGRLNRCKACVNAKRSMHRKGDGREAYLEGLRRWRAAHQEHVQEYERQYYEANRDRRRESKHLWHESLQKQVFDHYGWSCACCGSTAQITIDHIEGDGRQHREQLFGANYNGNAGRMYRWLIENGFPEGFQPLCRRCNRSKGIGAECRLDHGGDS